MGDFFDILTKYYPYYLEGARNTIVLALIGVVGGVISGLIICLMRMAKGKNTVAVVCRGFSRVYIEIFRGTPVIVQLWVAYFGIPKLIPIPDGSLLGMDFAELIPCMIAVCLNSGAYVAEVFRAGIEAVDPGQMEAALCVGMKKGMAMRLIVLPQAIKNVVPALCNEFVTLIKETAVISYLGVHDLFYMNSVVKTMTFNMLPSFLVLAAFYFVLCFTVSRLVGILERRLRA
ncbi:MAG: amino acid ABC transporter permease [Lachnospiraceae bacterium]|nr:amino acid ABC transporter permease [Lachnospiraceae bacterium]